MMYRSPGVAVLVSLYLLTQAGGATTRERPGEGARDPGTHWSSAKPAGPAAADTPWVGTHEHEAQWLHEQERVQLSPFRESRLTLIFDSISRSDGRMYVMRAEGRPGSREAHPASLRIDRNGRLESAWIAPDDMADFVTAPSPHRSADGFRARSIETGGGPLLADARLWDIAPLEVPALRPGAMTEDTLGFRVERFGFMQSLSGPRLTTLLRDTVVDGRTLWIGRDSARVELRQRLLEPRRGLDTLVVVERVVTGTLRGHFLYDPLTGLFRSRRDTLVAVGEASLHLPGGRVYRTPASFERRVAWTLRSPAEQRGWEEAEERRRRRDSFSIVRLPDTELQHRVAGGDTVAADSLIRAWVEASADRRRQIERDLSFAVPSVRDRIDSLRVEVGGAATRAAHARASVWGGPPLDSAAMAEYLRFLRDPALAFARGINTDPLYENLAGGMVMHPPTLDAPRERTSCTPAACRLVAAERDAPEPRLRKVALVASFIMEPERWVDSLLAREDTASHLLHPAGLLARGVGATWPAAEKRPIPGTGSDWREWQRWTGIDPHARRPGGGGPAIRWQSSHTYAVRMTERLTGRDIGAELLAALDTTTDAFGRSVLRTLALRLGAIRLSLDEIAVAARSEDPGARSEALTALREQRQEWQPADSALQQELATQLLTQAVDDDSIWSIGPGGKLPRPLDLPTDSERPVPLFIDGEQLPTPLRAGWDARPDATVIGWQEWRGQRSRSAAVLLQVGRATTLGPFARIDLARMVRRERDPEEGPLAWASGESFLLLRTQEGWVVLSVGERVT